MSGGSQNKDKPSLFWVAATDFDMSRLSLAPAPHKKAAILTEKAKPINNAHILFFVLASCQCRFFYVVIVKYNKIVLTKVYCTYKS